MNLLLKFLLRIMYSQILFVSPNTVIKCAECECLKRYGAGVCDKTYLFFIAFSINPTHFHCAILISVRWDPVLNCSGAGTILLSTECPHFYVNKLGPTSGRLREHTHRRLCIWLVSGSHPCMFGSSVEQKQRKKKHIPHQWCSYLVSRKLFSLQANRYKRPENMRSSAGSVSRVCFAKNYALSGLWVLSDSF